MVFIGLSGASCSDSTKSTNKAEKEDISKARVEFIMEHLNPEIEMLTLLSMKYNLSRETTGKIIKNYKKYAPMEILLKDFNSLEEFEEYAKQYRKPNILEFINKISIENNIEQTRIASLLVDFFIWDEIRNVE